MWTCYSIYILPVDVVCPLSVVCDVGVAGCVGGCHYCSL